MNSLKFTLLQSQTTCKSTYEPQIGKVNLFDVLYGHFSFNSLIHTVHATWLLWSTYQQQRGYSSILFADIFLIQKSSIIITIQSANSQWRVNWVRT